MRKSFCIKQEASANALDLSRDSNQVVIVGRNVFRVFYIGQDRFTERLNLRLGKNLNLSYSSIDVAWNRLYESQLATAAANGQVVLWDLNMPSRNKQLHSFIEHKRSCNKVTFHPSEPHLLVSGSQDGSVKLFDMRRQEPVMTFHGSVDSVRDVQFSGSNGSLLAAVTENGQVHLWERSRPDKCLLQLAAHFGPAYACRWHLTHPNWLATAGRDKTVKVWDLCDAGGSQPRLIRSIQTTASVGSAAWRPKHDHQIASTALLTDCSISIWDLSRPFVPYAILAAHSDVATCVAWRGNQHSLLSCGKDGALWLHHFENAQRPAVSIGPHTLAVCADGCLAVSFGDRSTSSVLPPLTPQTSSQATTASTAASVTTATTITSSSPPPSVVALVSATSTATTTVNTPPVQTASTTGLQQSMSAPGGQGWLPIQRCDDVLPALYHDANGETPETDSQTEKHSQSDVTFYNLNGSRVSIVPDYSSHLFDMAALHYCIGGNGVDIASACEHNEQVAYCLQLHDIATLWSLVRLMFVECPPSDLHHQQQQQQRHNTLTTTLLSRLDEEKILADDVVPCSPATEMNVVDEPTDTEVDEAGNTTELTMANIASGLANARCDFFFGDGEVNDPCLEYGDEDGGGTEEISTDLMTLPSEAFELRHELGDDAQPPTEAASDPLSPPTAQHVTHPVAALEQLHCRLVDIPAATVTEWCPWPLLTQLITDTARNADVQTACTLLLVMMGQIEVPDRAEQWLLAYIELLWQRKLWNTATRIIQRAPFPAVRALNQVGLHVCCGRCGRPAETAGWWCRRCSQVSSNCVVCHRVVRGLRAWCQGCSHGGHLAHMSDWFSRHRLCPTGCGHKCTPISA